MNKTTDTSANKIKEEPMGRGIQYRLEVLDLSQTVFCHKNHLMFVRSSTL
jgi:hypothetical protein